MGYTTEFEGSITIEPALKPEHAAYLTAFADTRRVRRNAAVAHKLADPARLAAGLGVGPEGAYFVGGAEDESVVNYNAPPTGQPGLWCQWVPDEAGTELAWNGAEKFYDYVEWMRYLMDHFLTQWGYRCNGSIKWYGEDRSDVGVLVVADNEVSSKAGHAAVAAAEKRDRR